MSSKEQNYYYVTSNGCMNLHLFFSMDNAIKEKAFFIDVFDKKGDKIIRYRKELVAKQIEYKIVEAI